VGVEIVVKIGGGLLGEAGRLESLLTSLGSARAASLVIVPGGGPFADLVREIDRRVSLSESAAHWMAVLAMNQYAELIASRLECSRLVSTAEEVDEAIMSGRVPVLAPYRWLRDADPLPHSWDVTSDSIAAWLAGRLGARRLVLVKPSGATGSLVDPTFASVIPPGVSVSIVGADAATELLMTLHREEQSSVVP